MRCIHVRLESLTYCFVAVVAVCGLAVAQEPSPGIAHVPHCTVALAEQADMPPQEAGVISEIPVKEGDMVAKDQLLLQLDDRKAQREKDVAQAKYEAAKAKAEDDINIRYAIAAEKVARAEYNVNVEANKKVPQSVPQVRLSELFLKCNETALAIEKARLDRTVAEAEARTAKAEVEEAKVMVDLLRLVSPIAGVVTDIRAHKGEAVQPSQAVIRVINLSTLWVQGDVPAAKYARAELEGRPVAVNVVITLGGKSEARPFPGKVIYVKPLNESGDTYMVRAKVANQKANGSWLLYPFMQAEMNIQLAR